MKLVTNAEQYMKTINDEIDTATEVDNGYFRKLVNRRKSGQSSFGSQKHSLLARNWMIFSLPFTLRIKKK